MAPPGVESYQLDTALSGAILNSFFINSTPNKVGIRPTKEKHEANYAKTKN
jgi:hypothetical protein